MDIDAIGDSRQESAESHHLAEPNEREPDFDTPVAEPRLCPLDPGNTCFTQRRSHTDQQGERR